MAVLSSEGFDSQALETSANHSDASAKITTHAPPEINFAMIRDFPPPNRWPRAPAEIAADTSNSSPCENNLIKLTARPLPMSFKRLNPSGSSAIMTLNITHRTTLSNIEETLVAYSNYT